MVPRDCIAWLRRKIDYVHNNPVEEGLVLRTEDYLSYTVVLRIINVKKEFWKMLLL